MIEIKNLIKKYDDLWVLKNIDLTINDGERVVIIGESGTGKSSLLRCINYLEKPTSGTIIYDGKLITNKNLRNYRQKVGMVFQSNNLFDNLTVLENIILAPVKLNKGKTKDIIREADELLKKLDMYDKRDVYPSSLSGGQKQRIAIIRTLMMKPKVILFDEPTSSLDPTKVSEVQDLMLKLSSEGITLVIVTHEPTFMSKVATKIVYMEDGRIIEEGTYQELKNSDKLPVKLFLSNIE